MNASLYAYALLELSATNRFQELPHGIAGPLQMVTGTDPAATDRVVTNPAATIRLAALVEPDLDVAYLQADDHRLVAAVLTHDRVIQAMFQHTTVLPLRFGTCFASLTDLQAHLANPRSPYGSILQQLAGKAEYLVKLTPMAQPLLPLDATLTGKAYFLAKKQQIQAGADLQQQQAAELNALRSQLAQTYAVHRSESPTGLENLYILGDRQAADQICDQISHWNRQSQHWQATCGPALPPYHFIE